MATNVETQNGHTVAQRRATRNGPIVEMQVTRREWQAAKNARARRSDGGDWQRAEDVVAEMAAEMNCPVVWKSAAQFNAEAREAESSPHRAMFADIAAEARARAKVAAREAAGDMICDTPGSRIVRL